MSIRSRSHTTRRSAYFRSRRHSVSRPTIASAHPPIPSMTVKLILFRQSPRMRFFLRALLAPLLATRARARELARFERAGNGVEVRGPFRRG